MVDVFSIESRVNQLISRHQDLLKKAEGLERSNNQLLKNKLEIEIELAEWKEKYKALQLSKALNQQGDSVEAKKLVQEVLREVDKCIALLGNDETK
jgi:vacuolar-type H+-ATPase subunit I/STV1